MQGPCFEHIGKCIERVRAADAEINRIRESGTCPGCTGGEIDLVLPDGSISRRPCPLISRECHFGSAQYDRAKRSVIRLMRDPVGVPARFVEAIGDRRRTVAMVEGLKWSGEDFLILSGGTGVGKSFAAAVIVSRHLWRMIGDAWGRAWEWEPRLRESAGRISWLSPYEIATEREWATGAAKTASLLVLDDLGNEPQTAKNVVSGVLSRRYDDRRPTLVTTNLAIPAIEDRYGRFVAERLAEHGLLVSCGDESLRLA